MAFLFSAKINGKEIQCISNNCIAEVAGENPSLIPAKEFSKQKKYIYDHGTDRERWEVTTLFSTAKNVDELTVPIIKSVELVMHLDPKDGNLIFEKPGLKQIFHIGPRQGTKNICPNYRLTVRAASEKHAVIKKVCDKFQYGDNQFHGSVNYFLYDMETAFMFSFWRGFTYEKDSVMPDARPDPVPKLNMTENGYEFKWTGINRADPKKENYTINVKYVREKDKISKQLKMRCINPEDPEGEFSGGPCETVGAPTILDQRSH